MLEWITNTISSLGYLGIALLMMLENIFPPIPSEVIMPLAGFTVQQGKLDLPIVILAGTLGSVLGTLPWFYFGKLVGERRLRQWIDRHGKWLTISTSDLDKSKQWFKKNDAAVVLFGRLIPGIRTYISIPAGFEQMSLLTYLLYSTIGTLIWIGLLSYTGFLLGQNYYQVKHYLGPVSGVVLISILIASGIWFFYRLHNKRKED